MTWTLTPASGVAVVIRNPVSAAMKRSRLVSSQTVLGTDPTVFDMALGPKTLDLRIQLFAGQEAVDTKVDDLLALDARSKQPITISAHKARYDGNWVLLDVDHSIDSASPNEIIVTMRLQKVA